METSSPESGMVDPKEALAHVNFSPVLSTDEGPPMAAPSTPGMFIASSNDEIWTGGVEFSTREEAVAGAADAMGLEAGDTFYVGMKEAVNLDVISGDRVIDDAVENVIEDVSDEVTGDWLCDVTDDEKDDLTLALNDAWKFWLARTRRMPTFFNVVSVTEHRYGARVV